MRRGGQQRSAVLSTQSAGGMCALRHEPLPVTMPVGVSVGVSVGMGVGMGMRTRGGRHVRRRERRWKDAAAQTPIIKDRIDHV